MMEIKIVRESTDKSCEFCRGYYVQIDGMDIPMIFDAPNYKIIGHLNLPSVQKVELCAFAESIKFFANETDFDNSHKDTKFSPLYFIPSGTFSPNNDKNFRENARAMLAGKVKTVQKLKNPVTENIFYRLDIENTIGTITVVAYLKEMIPRENAIVEGVFWFTGKIQKDFIDASKEETKKQGIFGRVRSMFNNL